MTVSTATLSKWAMDAAGAGCMAGSRIIMSGPGVAELPAAGGDRVSRLASETVASVAMSVSILVCLSVTIGAGWIAELASCGVEVVER